MWAKTLLILVVRWHVCILICYRLHSGCGLDKMFMCVWDSMDSWWWVGLNLIPFIPRRAPLSAVTHALSPLTLLSRYICIPVFSWWRLPPAHVLQSVPVFIYSSSTYWECCSTGGTVVEWLALLYLSRIWIQFLCGETFLCGVYMFSLCLPGYSGSLPQSKHMPSWINWTLSVYWVCVMGVCHFSDQDVFLPLSRWWLGSSS